MLFGVGKLRVTIGVADGLAVSRKIISGFAIKKEITLQACGGWGYGGDQQPSCYVLLARPLHSEANRGAEIECTP